MDDAGEGDDAASSGKRPTFGFSMNEPVRILVVGNDDDYEQVLRTTMGRLRLSNNVETAFMHTLADARRVLGSARVDLVLSDFLLPDGTSAELFKSLEEHSPDSHGVVLTTRPVDGSRMEATRPRPKCGRRGSRRPSCDATWND